MKRLSILFTLLYLTAAAAGQFNKFTTVRSTLHFNFAIKTPSNDYRGFGLHLDVGLFAKNKLMLLLSAHGDKFIGDKSLYSPNRGRINKAATIYGLQAGPEYFIFRKLAVSATYGIFQHSINDFGFSTDDGYRLGITTFLGNERRFVINISRTGIPRKPVNIRYYHLGLGWRIL